MSLFRKSWLGVMSNDYNISFIVPTYLVNLIKKTKMLDKNLAIELDGLYKIVNIFLLQISKIYNKYNILLNVFILTTFFKLEKPHQIIKDLKTINIGDILDIKLIIKNIFNFKKYSIYIKNPINNEQTFYEFSEILDDIFELFNDIKSYYLKLNKIIRYTDFLGIVKKEFNNINFNDFDGDGIKNFIYDLIPKYKNYEKDLKFLWSTIHKYIKEINNDYFDILCSFINELKQFKQKMFLYSEYKEFEITQTKIIIDKLLLLKKIYFLFKKINFFENNEINKRLNLLNLDFKQKFENFKIIYQKESLKDYVTPNNSIKYSVSGRIGSINFPFRNYIVPKQFNIELNNLDDNEKIILDGENVSPSVVGSTVEYLTHFMMGEKIENAFSVALKGIPFIEKIHKIKNLAEKTKNMLKNIKGLDDISIENACKIASFDCWRGNIIAILKYKPIKSVNKTTIKNIKKMVERSLKFWEKNGPIIKNHYTFDGGYSKLIPEGQAEGDFMSKDTIWDFKTSVEDPIKNNKYILQLIIYYIMGQHSNNLEFKNIKKIGFFNPRLNKVYVASLDILSKESIKEIEKDIIGYF